MVDDKSSIVYFAISFITSFFINLTVNYNNCDHKRTDVPTTRAVLLAIAKSIKIIRSSFSKRPVWVSFTDHIQYWVCMVTCT